MEIRNNAVDLKLLSEEQQNEAIKEQAEAEEQASFNPFDVYSEMYAQLNNGEKSSLDFEAFNQIMSGEIESDDVLALNVIQAALIDEDKENISEDELNALYNHYFGEVESTQDLIQAQIDGQFENLTQLYLGKSASECTPEEKNQAYMLNLIEGILFSSQEQLTHQDNLDGVISEIHDLKKEILNSATCQKDVEEALARQQEIVDGLKQAILDGNFEEKYKELTGVEFDMNKIIEYQETTYKTQILKNGITIASSFIEKVSQAGSIKEVLNYYTQYYGSEEIAKERLNAVLIEAAKGDNKPIGFINDNNEFEIHYYDEYGNIKEETGETLPLDETYYYLIELDLKHYMPEVKNYIEKFETTFNTTSEELLEKQSTLSQETLGKANEVTTLLTEYIQDQETFIDKAAQCSQITGLTLSCIGALVAFIPHPVAWGIGYGMKTAGMVLSIGGMFGDNLMEYQDLRTNNYHGEGEWEEYKSLAKETLIDVALFAAGYKINGIAESVADDMMLEYFATLKEGTTTYAIAHNFMEAGPDMLMSLATETLITGETDFQGETFSQVLGILTGVAFAKYNNARMSDIRLDAEAAPFVDPTTTGLYRLMENGGYEFTGDEQTSSSSSSSSMDMENGRRYVMNPDDGTITRVENGDTPRATEVDNEITGTWAGDNTGITLRQENRQERIFTNRKEIKAMASIPKELADIAKNLSNITTQDGSYRYSGVGIAKLTPLMSEYSKEIEWLSSFQNSKGEWRFNGSQIAMLAPLVKEYSTEIDLFARIECGYGSEPIKAATIKELVPIVKNMSEETRNNVFAIDDQGKQVFNIQQIQKLTLLSEKYDSLTGSIAAMMADKSYKYYYSGNKLIEIVEKYPAESEILLGSNVTDLEVIEKCASLLKSTPDKKEDIILFAKELQILTGEKIGNNNIDRYIDSYKINPEKTYTLLTAGVKENINSLFRLTDEKFKKAISLASAGIDDGSYISFLLEQEYSDIEFENILKNAPILIEAGMSYNDIRNYAKLESGQQIEKIVELYKKGIINDVRIELRRNVSDDNMTILTLTELDDAHYKKVIELIDSNIKHASELIALSNLETRQIDTAIKLITEENIRDIDILKFLSQLSQEKLEEALKLIKPNNPSTIEILQNENGITITTPVFDYSGLDDTEKMIFEDVLSPENSFNETNTNYTSFDDNKKQVGELLQNKINTEPTEVTKSLTFMEDGSVVRTTTVEAPNGSIRTWYNDTNSTLIIQYAENTQKTELEYQIEIKHSSSGKPSEIIYTKPSSALEGAFETTIYTLKDYPEDFDILTALQDGTIEQKIQDMSLPQGRKTSDVISNPDGSVTYIENHSRNGNDIQRNYTQQTDSNGNITATNYTYQITGQDGKTLLSLDRSWQMNQDGTTTTIINGKTYTTSFDDSTHGIKITQEDGTETIFSLKDLYADETMYKQNDLSYIQQEYGSLEGAKQAFFNFCKSLPADKLLLIKENITSITITEALESGVANGNLSTGMNIAIISHELGHAIDLKETFYGSNKYHLGKIASDENLIKIYEEEFLKFKKDYPKLAHELIGYFSQIGGGLTDTGLNEFIAEVNTLITTYGNNVQMGETRAEYLVRYFPETVAKIAQLLGYSE